MTEGKWSKYSAKDAPLNDGIDGFDYDHDVWICFHKNKEDFVMVYHNEFEPEGSRYYWGIYSSDGDGDCHGDLEVAKKLALEMMPND